MELDLPLHTLLVFRQTAALEIRQERRAAAAIQAATEAATRKLQDAKSWSTWFGLGAAASPTGQDGGSGSDAGVSFELSATEQAEDDELLARIQSHFFAQEASLSSSAIGHENDLNMRVVIQAAAEIRLSDGGEPIARAAVTTTARAEMRNAGICATFALENLIVEDLCTPSPLLRYILSPAEHMPVCPTPASRAAAPQLSIKYESKGVDSHVQIVSGPLGIVWNEPCIQKLISFVLSGDASPSSPSSPHSTDHYLFPFRFVLLTVQY